MPLFLVQLRKAINTNGIAYKWSNRYFADATNLDAALAQGLGWWDTYERTFHGELAFCYEIYANEQGDAPFSVGGTLAVPVGIQRGNISQSGTAGTVDLLPPFNVVRVDYPVAASRPSRKFYRIPLKEGDIASAQLVVALQGIIQNGADGLAGEPSMRDVDNQPFLGTASVRGITSRRLGRDAFTSVPTGPAFG